LRYRGVVSKKYNNSKSALILQKYTPEDIQRLLNSGKFKSEIVRQLKINIRAFDIYIKEQLKTNSQSEINKKIPEKIMNIEDLKIEDIGVKNLKKLIG